MAFNRLSNIQILLVDDEKQIIRLVTDVLSHLGFNSVTHTNDGRQAIELVGKQRFDIIITDWRMPEMEGIELIRFVRNSPSSLNPRVPIIMLTGNTETHYIFRARDAGVNEYMAKPFSASQLVRRIKSIIEKPKSFVEAPKYKGPNRRWHEMPPVADMERRKRAA